MDNGVVSREQQTKVGHKNSLGSPSEAADAPIRISYRSINSTKVPTTKPASPVINATMVPAKSIQNPNTKPRPSMAKPGLERPTELKVKQELDQLRCRYKANDFTLANDSDTTLPHTVIQFRKPIEDPDFPFDLEYLRLKITLPSTYPKEGSPASFEVLNNDIPEAVRCRIQNRMEEVAQRLTKGETNIKELLRILDKNLEKWMIALPTLEPMSTIKIIPASSIVVSPVCQSPSPSSKEEEEGIILEADKVSKSLEIHKVGIPIKKDMTLQSRYCLPEHIKLEPVSANGVAGTIRIDLSNLRLANVGLVIPLQLGLLLGCTRCRHTTLIKDLRPGSDRTVPCSGCGQYLELHYIREAIHSTSHKLGYLQLKRCYPRDLLPTCYQITCDHCAPIESLASSVRVNNVQVGERLSFPCPHCHTQWLFKYEGIAWTQIPSFAANFSSSPPPSKLPTKIGEPLPQFGTCSHYRKSHRWFRFPCCGRAYPCDECHAADPISKGHVAKWANRQICGYCSREFSTSQKFCECGESPATTTKHTAYWEGGKGARDQTTMSKKDRKKYRNREKTIPNRSKP